MTTFRYVLHERVIAYMRVGWMWCADLGLPHSQYGCLMMWPCKCECVEPKQFRPVRERYEGASADDMRHAANAYLHGWDE